MVIKLLQSSKNSYITAYNFCDNYRYFGALYVIGKLISSLDRIHHLDLTLYYQKLCRIISWKILVNCQLHTDLCLYRPHACGTMAIQWYHAYTDPMPSYHSYTDPTPVVSCLYIQALCLWYHGYTDPTPVYHSYTDPFHALTLCTKQCQGEGYLV